MANGKTRSRCSNWSHEETMLLAELRKGAFLNKREGRLVWERIALTISSRFPNRKRSSDQCRRRWETLTKTYKHVEQYCVETGQDHWQLDEDELSSMKLDTAYEQDWYNIVKQVCSHRKRKEKDDCIDSIALEHASKRSNICSSPFSVVQLTPREESLYVSAPVLISEPVSITTLGAEHDHERLTSVNGKISSSSLEVEKLSPEEEIRKLKRENDALILELAQLRQPSQITQQDQAEQDDIGCELMVAHSILPKLSSHGQCFGAMNSAGCNGFDPFDSPTYLMSTPFSPEMEFGELDVSPATWIDGLRYVLLYSILDKGYMIKLKLYGVHLRVAQAGAHLWMSYKRP